MSILTNSSGLSITPIQDPFTNIFDVLPKYSGLHSNTNSIEVCALNHLIIGKTDEPIVICVLIAKCLCNPIFPPSGVSIGSIKPH